MSLGSVDPRTVDRCMCGAVQGMWWDPSHVNPFRHKLLIGTHSPIGCFRHGGSQSEVDNLFWKLKGMWPSGIDRYAAYQVVMMSLRLQPDLAQNLEIVLSEVPLFPSSSYEFPSPATRRTGGRVLGSTVAPKPLANSPARWDPSTGRIKPPWEK